MTYINENVADQAVAHDPVIGTGPQSTTAQTIMSSLADITTLKPNGTDDTAALQSCNGKSVKLGAGTFYVTQLTFGENTHIEGMGKGITTIKLKNNTNTTMIHLHNADNSSIKNLTLDGNKANNMATVTDTTTSVLLIDCDSTYTASSLYMDLQNINILNGQYNGLYLMGTQPSNKGYNWVFHPNNIHILECNGYGFKDETTDNTFSNFYISGCSLGDLFLNYSANNKYVNFKCDNGGQTLTSSTSTDGANVIMFHCQSVQLTNFDCQASYHYGVKMLSCTDSLFSGSMDSNGQGSTGTGMIIDNSYNIDGNLIFGPGNACQTMNLIINSNCTDISFNCVDYGTNKVTNNGTRCVLTSLKELSGYVKHSVSTFFNSASISIPNATSTALHYDSTTHDLDGMWSNTNGGSVTIKNSGWYQVFVRVAFDINATGMREIELHQNSTAIAYNNVPAFTVAGYYTIMEISTLKQFNAGDTVSVYVYQNSGGALNVISGTTYNELSLIMVN